MTPSLQFAAVCIVVAIVLAVSVAIAGEPKRGPWG